MNPITRLVQWVKDAGTKGESNTDGDGFLSHSAEVHAVGHGLYNGMKSWRARPKGLPDNPDVLAEPHYYKGAYVAGTLLQAGLVILAAVVVV